MAGLLLTLCFNRLEFRIRQLLHAGEHALRPLQDRLATATTVPELRLIDLVEKPVRRFTAYSDVIIALHVVSALALIGGAVYAAFVASPPAPPHNV